MTLQGFVTVGRVELLLALVSVALLMGTCGYLLAQLVTLIRKPDIPSPLYPKCVRAHCEDDTELWNWLRRKDYALVTNEVLTGMQNDLARYRNRPTTFEAPKIMTPEQERALIDAILIAKSFVAKRRREEDIS